MQEWSKCMHKTLLYLHLLILKNYIFVPRLQNSVLIWNCLKTR